MTWLDTTPPDQVEVIRKDLTKNQVPILAPLAGPGSAAYSNEADVREPDFQTTFFGPHFVRLSGIKTNSILRPCLLLTQVLVQRTGTLKGYVRLFLFWTYPFISFGAVPHTRYYNAEPILPSRIKAKCANGKGGVDRRPRAALWRLFKQKGLGVVDRIPKEIGKKRKEAPRS